MNNTKQVNKKIHREDAVQDKVLSGIDKITLPVVQTIGPMGKNVMFQDALGNFILTNDGVTIAREIDVDDQIEAAVIDIFKGASKRTNVEAGDGTSTTILLSRALALKALALKKKGLSQRMIREMLERVVKSFLVRLTEQKREVKDEAMSLEIAKISANNDAEIAQFVVDAVKTAGLDGMIFIDVNNDEPTLLETQAGFRVPAGMIYQNLYNDVAKPVAQYEDLPVVIFDKAIYYEEEAQHIIRTAMDLNYKKLVVVAKDFVGDAPNTFIANHAKGNIKLVLIKVANETQIQDLAVYIDGSVVSEAEGRRVDSLMMGDFTMVESVFADPQKCLIKTGRTSSSLKKRVNELKKELAKDKDNPVLKDRIASLTNGIVTIKVGGRTLTEVREKMYRYEDAISAVRSAKRSGFLVGGGLGLYNAYNPKDYKGREENEIALIISRASVDQLAENSNIELDYDQLTKDVGLNALTGQYENLLKAGVVEPFRATELALKNAASVANILTSIGTYIVNDYADESKEGDE